MKSTSQEAALLFFDPSYSDAPTAGGSAAHPRPRIASFGVQIPIAFLGRVAAAVASLARIPYVLEILVDCFGRLSLRGNADNLGRNSCSHYLSGQVPQYHGPSRYLKRASRNQLSVGIRSAMLDVEKFLEGITRRAGVAGKKNNHLTRGDGGKCVRFPKSPPYSSRTSHWNSIASHRLFFQVGMTSCFLPV